MVKQTLVEIPVYYPAFLLGFFVVMPNHIHAIVISNNGIYNGQAQGPVPTDINISFVQIHHYKIFVNISSIIQQPGTRMNIIQAITKRIACLKNFPV